MVEAYRRDTASKDQLISELKATKKRLDSEVKELRQELIQLRGDKKSVEAEQSRLQKEMSRVQQQMATLEGHLESVQRERDEMETHLQVWGCADGVGLPWWVGHLEFIQMAAAGGHRAVRMTDNCREVALI